MEKKRVQQRATYHLHIELDKDYEPIHKRSKISTISTNDMHVLRYHGKKHFDIWSDGRLYPVDPITNSTPPFSNCSSLLKYLGDGSNGLLGYTYNLASERDIIRLENHLLRREKESMLQILEENKEKISSLEETIKSLKTK